MIQQNIWADLTSPLLLRPLAAAVMIGVICAVIGTYVILRNMVFLVDGIAHSAFAGGALSLLLGLNPFLAIGSFGVVTALGMGYFNERGKLSNDTAVGIIFAFMMALGVIFIGLFRSYTTGVSGLLFGNIVTTSPQELAIISGLGILVFGSIYLVRKELFFITFHPEIARANGIPVALISYLFLILTGLAVTVSIRIIGVILLLALIVTPAAAAYQFTYNLAKMTGLAAVFAAVGAVVGYIIAYLLEVAASAIIVVALTIIFIISMVVSPKRRGSASADDMELCAVCQQATAKHQPCKYCEDEEEHNHGHHGGNHCVG